MGKAAATRLTLFITSRLARPTTAFCSMMAVGKRSQVAASITGTEG